MPTYDYRCGACGHTVEYFHAMSDAPKKKCPKCGKSKLVRQLGTGAGILFKGSGFYQTDYRSDAYKKSASADKPADAATGAGASDTKTSSASGTPSADAGEAKKKPKAK